MTLKGPSTRWLAGILMAVIALVGVVVATDGVSGLVIGLPIAVGCAHVAVRTWRLAVVVTPEQVAVRGMFRTTRFPNAGELRLGTDLGSFGLGLTPVIVREGEREELSSELNYVGRRERARLEEFVAAANGLLETCAPA